MEKGDEIPGLSPEGGGGGAYRDGKNCVPGKWSGGCSLWGNKWQMCEKRATFIQMSFLGIAFARHVLISR
jgi:hypothetical protein